MELEECKMCSRRFTKEALEKHSRACHKVFQAKRKVREGVLCWCPGQAVEGERTWGAVQRPSVMWVGVMSSNLINTGRVSLLSPRENFRLDLSRSRAHSVLMGQHASLQGRVVQFDFPQGVRSNSTVGLLGGIRKRADFATDTRC